MIVVERLQSLVTWLSQGATSHLIQSRIFAAQRLNKLAEKYAAHAAEEQNYIVKFIDRIIALGGDVKNEDKTAELIYKDAVEYLNYDLQVSKDSLEWLAELIADVQDDSMTFQLLSDYYQEEKSKMLWTEQQLEMIEMIGRQNWLDKQL